MNGRPALLKLRFLADFRSFRLFPFLLVHPHLTSCNPSIAMQGGTIFFSMRHSNVLVLGNRSHFGKSNAIAGNAQEILNENSFGIVRLPEWGGSLDCTLFEERAAGFEDIRIVEHGGRWYGLACKPQIETMHGAPTFHGSAIHLLAFGERFRLEGTVPLPSPTRAQWEKNWVPFRKDDGLFVVHQPSPLFLLSLDIERRRFHPVFQGKGPRLDRSRPSEKPWSGSSQIVPYGKGTFLGVIHRKFLQGEELVVEHAFIRLTPSFETEISQSFHFASYGIEFCAGFVARPDDVVLSFGSHNDTRAYLATLGRDEVEKLFEAPAST